MSDAVLEGIREIIQRDVNNRGLATDPRENLFTYCQADLAAACRSLASASRRTVAIVTGFYIPDAKTHETDGPLGALLLAKVLGRLDSKVVLMSESPCYQALDLELNSPGFFNQISTFFIPELQTIKAGHDHALPLFTYLYMRDLTHLIAVERAGPSYTAAQWPAHCDAELVEQFPGQGHQDQYHTMRGKIITEHMCPAHKLFELASAHDPPITTIGIGDGGNEIGMGKIPWEVIARNVPNGGLVACRVATDYNIVCGVSNWGAYGLAAGVWHLSGRPFEPDLFDADRERALWEKVLAEAARRGQPLVDGVTGKPTLTVDGLSWDDYIRPLREIGELLKSSNPP